MALSGSCICEEKANEVRLRLTRLYCMDNLKEESVTPRSGIYLAYPLVNWISRLDYPGAAFPVTFANPERDPKMASYIPLNDTDKSVYDKCTSTYLYIADFRWSGEICWRTRWIAGYWAQVWRGKGSGYVGGDCEGDCEGGVNCNLGVSGTRFIFERAIWSFVGPIWRSKLILENEMRSGDWFEITFTHLLFLWP